jgi:hypothetical protein
MRKLLTFLIALGTLALASVPARTWTPQEFIVLFRNRAALSPAARPGPPTFTFENATTGTTNATTYAITTGTASANRLVVTVLDGFAATNPSTIVSAVYDGSIIGTVTQIQINNNPIHVITAPIPTGTSSTLVVTWTNAQTGVAVRAINYTTDITTLSSTAPVTSLTNLGESATSITGTIAVANSGSVLLFAGTGQGITNGTQSMFCQHASPDC